MTDPDANPDKPVPHGTFKRRCPWCIDGVLQTGVLCPHCAATPCRQYVDREQRVPTETIAEFTKKYGEWKP
jgi:hypothetical protein